MYHAYRVSCLQGLAYLDHDRNDLLRCELQLLLEDGAQVLPFDVVHADELDSISFS